MPPLLPHRAGFPVPDGYVVRRRMPVGLIVAGTLTLGSGYAVGLAARGSDRASPADRALAIPIIGPFIALAGKRETPCDIQDVDTDSIDSADDLNASKDEVQSCVNGTLDEASQLVLIAADGIVQVVGASLLVAGLAGGRQELVREDLVRKRSAGTPTARLRLRRFGQVWGLGLVGSF
jgi:hypothetical protein